MIWPLALVSQGKGRFSFSMIRRDSGFTGRVSEINTVDSTNTAIYKKLLDSINDTIKPLNKLFEAGTAFFNFSTVYNH